MRSTQNRMQNEMQQLNLRLRNATHRHIDMLDALQDNLGRLTNTLEHVKETRNNIMRIRKELQRYSTMNE
ncbi:hypothetical protein [Paenibacillus tarimensis]|uniref:hypothetical protein n=1 Tax=Paenibacillus tarimensis TaxID=416012 RepID=UPI001F47B297|nr:hypothetical protein [Paenibacillus tarimensis]MCF2945021.1 hypothetical protein [Paenibacillus tarimensis]